MLAVLGAMAAPSMRIGRAVAETPQPKNRKNRRMVMLHQYDGPAKVQNPARSERKATGITARQQRRRRRVAALKIRQAVNV
jgi:hypothetical protein